MGRLFIAKQLFTLMNNTMVRDFATCFPNNRARKYASLGLACVDVALRNVPKNFFCNFFAPNP